MRRRTFLATLGLALAGCLGTEPDDGGSSPAAETPTATPTATPTPTPTPAADPSLVGSAFRASDRCPVPGDATVTLTNGDVSVGGCLQGADGCAVATLDAVIFDTRKNTLTVVVAASHRGDTDQACTQVITDLGYEVDVSFEGGPPAAVSVVHDDARGRRTVTKVVPDEEGTATDTGSPAATATATPTDSAPTTDGN